MNENILEIKDLHVGIYTDNGIANIVQGINLNLKRGEIHGVVGESGCGKTVTAKSVLRLHDENNVKYSGSIQYNFNNTKKDILSLKEKELKQYRGKEIAYIFQNPMTSFDNLFTVGEQIAEGIREHLKLSKKDASNKSVELLNAVGVTPADKRAVQYPYEFSGGMLQRAMIAMAISCEPKILIADEATTALDVTMQARVLELLKKLRDDKGLSILCITHNFGVVAEICDTVTVMYSGKVVENGPVEDIFHNPGHPYTKELIESISSDYNLNGEKPQIISNTRDVTESVTGCIYAGRCKYAQKKCFDIEPKEHSINAKHRVRCHKCKEVEV